MGRNRDDSCTFDESMKHIELPTAKARKGSKTTWQGSTDIDADFFPGMRRKSCARRDTISTYDTGKPFLNLWSEGSIPQLGIILMSAHRLDSSSSSEIGR
jgi:hypothetical protein